MGASDGRRLFVSNLVYSATEDDLRELFEPFGALREVKVVTDPMSGTSRGFGFVEFEEGPAAGKAMRLAGQDFHGRRLRIEAAKPREQR